MVNKQYTIQKSPPKLNPRQSSLGSIGGGGVVVGNKTPPGSIRHPSNCNLGTISEESNRLHKQQLKMDNFDETFAQPTSPPSQQQPPALGLEYQSDYQLIKNCDENCEKKINEILFDNNSLPGRFQYILQMDKEMVSTSLFFPSS